MSGHAWVTAGLLLMAPTVAFADRAAEVAALEAKCEQEREAKIAPLRAPAKRRLGRKQGAVVVRYPSGVGKLRAGCARSSVG